MYSSFFRLIILFLVQFQRIATQEILGCGGFVKSKVPIDFSKVEIKLVTPEGIQKYQTECAPNNGYYMVPFVDKGDFILKVQPPKGWSFEPTYVELHVDGVNDPCSQGRDINFEFLGFTISGKISSAGVEEGGPEGVSLTLKKAETSEVVGTTQSLAGGDFDFPSVLPGQYKIIASHKSYSFKQSEIPVTVAQTNVQCSSRIVVSGYDVSGKVSAAQLPVKDVHMLLFSTKRVDEQVEGCNVSPPTGSGSIIEAKGMPYVCSVTSDEKGLFTFLTLPPQDYILVPFHKAEHIEFDFEPHEMTFTVTSGSVVLSQNFAVTGFSVSGLVLDSPKGNPVPGARVLVNGKDQATTDENGLYRLQHMNSGMYTITVEKKDIFFPESSVRVGSDTPRLPDIVARAFSLCGRLEVNVKPTKPFKMEQLSASLTKDDAKDKKTAKLKKDGTFCINVSPGSYSVVPVVPSGIASTGIVLTPSILKVTVENRPVKDLKFEQMLVDISATVQCIDVCGEVKVEMVMESDSQKKSLKSDKAGKEKSVKITFRRTLPGKYSLKAIQDRWCWESNATTITAIGDKATNAVEFRQSGYKLTCSISHDVDMAIRHNDVLVNTFPLKKGRNQLCLAKPGKYQLQPRSCHKFELSKIVFNTAHPQPVVLQAVSHQVTVIVRSSHSDEDLRIAIRSKTKGKELSLKPGMETSTEPETYTYTASYQARDGESLVVTPKSETLLVEPRSFTGLVKADDCDKDFTIFKAYKGLFIEGSVSPPLQEVDITVSAPDDASIKPSHLKTDKNGKYKVGPLNPSNAYSITASKDGYVLIQDENKFGDFLARKLAKISFGVAVEEGEQLSGVLITISGGSYRSNNLTNAEGNLVLEKLEPGQYYFKAMMKEYEFQPSSQVIEIKEGDEVKIAIKGKRVAFSCLGSVTSLNGQPETGVTVRAFAVGQGLEHAEEATTSEMGEFRIKGLTPNVEYQIEVKRSDLFERISPSEVMVTAPNEDVKDVHFIAFRSMSQFEVSGNVVTKNEFLRYLKIVMYKASEPGMPVHSASLSSSPFFHLPPLARDNQEYHIRLESTLDKSRYSYTEPAAGFFATGVYKHITFQFHPQVKMLEQETPQASYLTLPITILIILLFYNHTQVMNWLLQMYEKVYFANGNGNRKDASEHGASPRVGGRKARKEK